MRLCPSVEGSGSPLITHRIGVGVCMARQDSNFHKCHRCQYRGQAASWEPQSSPLPSLQITDESREVTVKTIEIPRPVKKPTKTLTPSAGSKSAVKKAAQTA